MFEMWNLKCKSVDLGFYSSTNIMNKFKLFREYERYTFIAAIKVIGYDNYSFIGYS